VIRVVIVSKAKVTVEHHFLVGNVSRGIKSINSLPLVIASGYTEFRSPTFHEHRSIVVVVELALVGFITPVTIETRVLWLGLS